METLSFEQVKEYFDNFTMIPICKEIYADESTPITLLKKLEASDKNFFLLESVEGGEKWARYSFLGYKPILRIKCKDGKVLIKSGEVSKLIEGEPLEELRKLLNKYKSPKIKGMPTFTGGLVGYFGYSVIKYSEPKLNLKSSDFDDYNLMLFDKVIAFDHLRQKILVIANVKSKDMELGYNSAISEIDSIINLIKNNPIKINDIENKETADFKSNMSKKEYCEIVEKGKQHIYEGDVFQVVLSRKFEAKYSGSLINPYRVLRTTNPSPYMYYIQSEDVQIAGASPETMVKLVDGKLTTFPVAGTRPRGKNENEDIANKKSLMKDEKELSEHNMLVDLGRNDIGKISKYGTVKVEEYMKIHSFSKVMHISSTVCGEIKNGKDSIDAVASLLPAGTLSGAPKFRACEIIEGLEKSTRGIYGGAIGYMDLSGNMDVCIAIRTAVKKGNTVTVQAGAGIVADSIPEKEYEECENKAAAIIEAIKRGSEVNR